MIERVDKAGRERRPRRYQLRFPLIFPDFRGTLKKLRSRCEKVRSVRRAAKFCSAATVILLVYAALGPAKWQLRMGLGPSIEHFLAFFVVTSIVCIAWPRPFVVAGCLMVVSPLLEALQVFTPDRTPDALTAFWGAAGALAAALLAELFIRAWRRA